MASFSKFSELSVTLLHPLFFCCSCIPVPKMGSGSSSPASGQATSPQSGCPVPVDHRTPAVYNVYNQKLDSSAVKGSNMMDPRNNMPMAPSQLPFPGQKKLLSTEREVSAIPKGGTEATWVYPSPQMFYNALMRKGKGADVQEEDMTAVVGAHNMLNDLTWGQVSVWEQLHSECTEPKLMRFTGRPHDLSPLARMKGWLGHDPPFDRHDWFVDRCGKEVRYVIDFYFDESKAGSSEAFSVDSRPAIDTFEALNDRIKMAIYTTFAKYGWPCPITGHSGTLNTEHGEHSEAK